MNKKDFKKLVKNPKFISGIYNYCDRWCERCQFTSRCLNYDMSEKKFDTPESKDIGNKIFWDKMQEVFTLTREMLENTAKEMGIDLNKIDDEEIGKSQERVRKFSKEQRYSIIALEYAETVKKWFEANRKIFEDKQNELVSHLEAQIPGTNPNQNAIEIKDCLEVISWYQYQIYVKLCRAASGLVNKELDEFEHFQEDADGSAKVAIIGLERSISAWGGLLNYFPQQEKEILNILINLKTLLRLVDESFPDARGFKRPGFDK